jgi:hypothetical protein
LWQVDPQREINGNVSAHGARQWSDGVTIMALQLRNILPHEVTPQAA